MAEKSNNICIECDNKATYGFVINYSIEKTKCKKHKCKGMCGRLGKWYKRYDEFKNRIFALNCELIDTKEKFEFGAKKYGQKYKPYIKHNDCGKIFNSTSIDCLIHEKNIGCGCTTNIPWYKRYDEFIEKIKKLNCEMIDTKEKFIIGAKKYRQKYKPYIKHNDCSKIFNSTSINHIINNKRIGCGCTTIPWYKRYDEFIEKIKELNCEMIDTKEKFEFGTTDYGYRYKPKIKHNECGKIFNSTTICSIINGKHIGCGCKTLIPWYKRYDEFIEKIKELNCEMIDTKEKFEFGTTDYGYRYKPKIKHNECGKIFNSTTICSIINGKHIGCVCKNKTESLIQNLIEQIAEESKEINASKNQGLIKVPNTRSRCRYDHKVYTNYCISIGETDGYQHFPETIKFGPETIKNDLNIKIPICIENNWSMFRIDQEWAWNNREKPILKKMLRELIMQSLDEPLTLCLMKIHAEKYKDHIETWETTCEKNGKYINIKLI